MSEKSGKTDEKSIWAQARVAHSAQFLKQIYGIQEEGTPRMLFYAIVVFDENHKKVYILYYIKVRIILKIILLYLQVVLGHTSKFEYIIARNQVNGTIWKIADGELSSKSNHKLMLNSQGKLEVVLVLQ